MFKKVKENNNLKKLLEESQALINASRNGSFNYNLSLNTEDEQLQQIVNNFIEFNALRDEYELSLLNRLNTMLQMNKSGFWELYL